MTEKTIRDMVGETVPGELAYAIEAFLYRYSFAHPIKDPACTEIRKMLLRAMAHLEMEGVRLVKAALLKTHPWLCEYKEKIQDKIPGEP